MKYEQLNKNEIKNRDELKKAGAVLRAESEGSKEDLRGLLRSKVADRKKIRVSIWEMLSVNRSRFVPVLGMAAVLLLAVIIYPKPVRYDNYPISGLSGGGVAMESNLSALGSLDSSIFRSIPKLTALTLYTEESITQDKKHEYQEDNGSRLERHLRVDLLLKGKDSLKNVREVYEEFGGYIDNIRLYSSTSMHISGNVPADRADDLRFELQKMAGGDRFVLQTENSVDKIPGLVSIDEKVSELEEALHELEIELAATSDRILIVKLESKIEGIENQIERLNERKEAVDDKVDYVSFQIEVNKIPRWYSSSNSYEVNQAISGYEDPTVVQRVLINIALVIVYSIVLLSYTFWIVIPLLIWRYITRRDRKLMNSLE